MTEIEKIDICLERLFNDWKLGNVDYWGAIMREEALLKRRYYLASKENNKRSRIPPVEPPKHQTHTSTPIKPSKPLTSESGAFEQDSEDNEYRYISAPWLNEVAIGLTAGAKKHPNETWRGIPAEEHVARAIRHLNMYLMGDRSEPHLTNASMRVMMARETENDADD